jgi:hypothetical protein
MTGPKDKGKPGQKLGGWQPLICSVCGWKVRERNPARAVTLLEKHLYDEHGIEL